MADNSLQESLIKKGQQGMNALNTTKKITTVMLLIGMAYLFMAFVLPFLVTVTWNLISLCIGGAILFVFAIIANQIYKRWPYIIEMINKYTFGLIIETDEFVIQETEIKEAEKEVENMLEKRQGLQGKYVELSRKVSDKKNEIQVALKKAEIAKQNLVKDPSAAEVIDDAQQDATRANNYVETIEPIAEDLNRILLFTDEMYKVIKRKIKNAKKDLEASKDLFYSAQTGADALLSAQKAMIGNPQLNADSATAKEAVMRKIALSVGQMRSSMEVLNEVAKGQNYADKAALALAMEKLHKINNSDDDKVQISMPASTSFKGIAPVQKYGDIL